MELLWGIDLGGTKTEIAVCPADAPTSPILRKRIETHAEQGYDAIIRGIVALVEAARSEISPPPTSIGIGHPGTLDPSTGVLKNSNTVCLNGQPLDRDLEKALGLRVRLANDANCFVLAEAIGGAAQGHETVFGIIMGTGVGGGLVVRGQVLHGHHGIAGEWGHNLLDPDGPHCYCGKRGCVETILSGPALESFYRDKAGSPLRLPEIVRLAREGSDPVAVQTLDRLVSEFAKALAVVINIFDPHCIVLGGGVSNTEELLSLAPAALLPHLFNPRFDAVLVRNTLGDSAGVFGAALLTHETTRATC